MEVSLCFLGFPDHNGMGAAVTSGSSDVSASAETGGIVLHVKKMMLVD